MKTTIAHNLEVYPQAQSADAVLAYENDAVLARIKKDCKVSDQEAQQLFKDMLMFLYLSGAIREARRLSPPKLIDEAWHAFILFTADYHSFCMTCFGHFIHHRPNRPGESWGNEGLRNCLAVAREVFGESLSENWGPFPTDSSQCDYPGCKPDPECCPAECDNCGPHITIASCSS